MTEPLRVALLGYGLAGSVFHAPFISAVEGLDLAVVTTRDSERRRQAEKTYPGVLVLDGPEEVFSRAEELDLVVVATPNTLHLPHALARSKPGSRSSSTSRWRRPPAKRGGSSTRRATGT